jgi:hypothetical protein
MSIPATGSLLPLHPRLREHGMTRADGRLIGSLRGAAELISLSIDRMTPAEIAEVKKQLLVRN